MIVGRRKVALGLGIAMLVQAMTSASVLAAALRSPAGLLPVAVNDTATAVHGRLRSVAAPGVLGNDLQLGVGFTAKLVSGVSNGTLDLNANGSYTYQSDLSFVGTDQFRYKVDGGLLGLSNVATVTITVTNAAPVANPDGYSAVANVERSIPVLTNDDDADGDRLTIDIVTEPANGNLNERPDGSIRYKADSGFAGTDTFRYRAWDGAAWSNTVTVTMTVSLPATPSPTPSPTATATPTPTPSPLPTSPLPTSPLPTSPLPTLPLPTGTPTPTSGPTPTPVTAPGASSRPTPPPGAIPAPAPTPIPSTGTTSPPRATTDPSGGSVVPAVAGGGPGGSAGPADPGATSGPVSPRDRFTVPGVEPGSEVVFDAARVAFDGFEWAVPALVLTVPGLLLILAIVAQASIGIAFLPVARRWLGGDRRRRV